VSPAMAQDYMRYGYVCKEYMHVATSSGSILPIGWIDLKMDVMRKPR
jgi:hypothetical protein